jgi:hypothetical protein
MHWWGGRKTNHLWGHIRALINQLTVHKISAIRALTSKECPDRLWLYAFLTGVYIAGRWCSVSVYSLLLIPTIHAHPNVHENAGFEGFNGNYLRTWIPGWPDGTQVIHPKTLNKSNLFECLHVLKCSSARMVACTFVLFVMRRLSCHEGRLSSECFDSLTRPASKVYPASHLRS